MRTPMHEWPLVLFTALAIAGAGTLAAEPLLAAFGAVDPAVAQQRAGWAAMLMVVGLVASLGHLGRPGRLALASRRFGLSALSTEVVLATIVAAGGGVLALSPAGAAFTRVLAWGSAAASLAFLVSLGLVYGLRGQVTWRGAAVAGPLFTGLSYGVVAHAAAAPDSLSRILVPALVLLAVDGALLGARWRRIGAVQPWLTPAYPHIFRHRHLLLTDRLLLVTLAPAVLLIVSAATLADLSLGIGLLVDRITFYGLAVQQTTEAEVRRVEALIARE